MQTINNKGNNVKNMRNNNFQKVLPQTYETEKKFERAVAFVCDKYLPIQNIIIGKTEMPSQYSCYREASRMYTFMEYILSGEGEILSLSPSPKKGIWNKFKAGDCFILRQNDRHEYHTTNNSKFKKIWISFSSYYIDQMLDGYGICTSNYSPDVKTNFDLFDDLLASNVNFNDMYFPFASSIHQIILAVAAEISQKIIDPVLSIKNKLLNSVYTKCSLEQIANSLHLSKSTLIRKFKTSTGITPYDFLLREKIKTAKALLKTTRLSIKEISNTLNFTDEHYFSFIFNQKTGITPSEYRTRNNTFDEN